MNDRPFFGLVLALVALAGAACAGGYDTPAKDKDKDTTPHDDHPPAAGPTHAPTPSPVAKDAPDTMDQGQSARDVEITAQIRRAILEDTSLASSAGNVKIITAAGVVTLRGPVASEAERATIESKAKAVAGVTRVDNQLEIKAQ